MPDRESSGNRVYNLALQPPSGLNQLQEVTVKQVNDELIELRSLRFHYRDWSATQPDAPVLVLLHGFTGHARSWDWLAEHLSDRYRVLALDQRGHGETQWAPHETYNTEQMAHDLQAFVAAMGLKSYALLGLSMGGSVSIRFAGERPAGLGQLVIVDIGPELVASGLTRIQTGVQATDVFESRELAFAASRRANTRAPDEHLRHRVWNSLMRTENGQWTYRYDRALRDPSTPRQRMSAEQGWRSLANINVPTLIVRGAESDILSVEIAQRMTRELPGAQLVEIAEAGHSVPLDQPDRFLKAINNFLH